MFYENVTWDGNITKKFSTIYKLWRHKKEIQNVHISNMIYIFLY